MPEIRGVASRGERKLATMLFVDLSGYTEMSISADPEDVRSQIRPLLDGLIAIAEMHGAHVGEIEGDGFLAIFGIPNTRVDDPLRAVRSADRMSHFVSTRDGDQKVHMGIASGEVFAEIVRDRWAVNGAAVNLAARLCSAAPPGGVFVDPVCARLAGDGIAWNGKRRVDLKGYGEAQDVFVLDAVLDQMDPVAPVVYLAGRDQELRSLNRALEDVVTTRRSRLISIVGEPGIGKTSLVSSWAHATGALLLFGKARGAPFDMPFDPLASALRAVPSIETLNSLPASWQADDLASVWKAVLGVSEEDLGRVHVGRDGVLASGFRQALREIAEHQVTVLCLDDIHEAATDVRMWLEELNRKPIAGALLVVTTSRAHWTDDENSDVMVLGALDMDQAQEFVESVVGAPVGSEFVEDLLLRTGGNPLFLRESLKLLLSRSLIEDRLRISQERLREIPETVRLVLAARLDSLPIEVKQVLQAASVWGDEGPIDALAHLGVRVSGLGAETDGPHGLFSLRGGRWSFAHSLVREVVYSSLPKRERCALHELILEMPKITKSQKAFHSAAVLGLDVANTETEKASLAQRAIVETTRHVRAVFAVEARAARDSIEASGVVIKAASKFAVEEAITLLLIGSAAAAEMGDFVGGEGYARQALVLVDGLAGNHQRAKVLVALARCLSRTGELSLAREIAEECIEMLEGRADAEAMSIVGHAQMAIGTTCRYVSFSAWVGHLELAYQAFILAEDFDGAAEASRMAAYVLSTSASEEHHTWIAKAVRLTKSDDVRGHAWISRSQMLSALGRGLWTAAIEAASRARDLAEGAGLRDIVLEAEYVVAEASAKSGSPSRTIDIRIRLLRDQPDDRRTFAVEAYTALGFARCGDAEAARAAVEGAALLAARFGDVEMLDAHLARGDVSADLGDLDAAEGSYLESIRLARRCGLELSELAGLVKLVRIRHEQSIAVASSEVLSLATRLTKADALGHLEVLSAIWPTLVPRPEAAENGPEVRALRAQTNGDWHAAAEAWAELGVSAYLANALEKSGQAERAADVRAILAEA